MTTTKTLITAIAIMLAVNLALAMVQSSITEVNPSGAAFFDVEDSPYANYVQNDTLVVDDSYFISDEGVEGDTSGNVFSDTYKKVRGWLQQKMAPLNFLGNMLKQPYGFLKDVGVPQDVALAFGAIWYMIIIFLFVSWVTGR